MIEPLTILGEAKLLLASPAVGISEIRQRTIISRAYYAAFHHLRVHPRLARYRRRDESGVGMHKDFVDFLCRAGDRELVHVGRVLGKLHRQRIHADYWLDKDLNRDAARLCVQDAEYVCHDLLTEG